MNVSKQEEERFSGWICLNHDAVYVNHDTVFIDHDVVYKNYDVVYKKKYDDK